MNTNRQKIAVFDSGIGGITFLREAVRALPHEDFIYYADADNVPYGTKPKEEVKKFIFQAADFLSSQDIKILVIACNSATSAAIKDLRLKYDFPIIGMEPAVKPAVENSADRRVLVAATTLTLNEEKLNNLITNVDKRNQVDKTAMDRLVKFAEEFRFKGEDVEKYIANALPRNIDDYGTIVLGCTHFIFFKPLFRKIIPSHIEIIDGNTGTLNHMLDIMKNNKILASNKVQGKIYFFSSGKIDDESRTAKLRALL